MIELLIGFFAGLFIGELAGVFTMALATISRDADSMSNDNKNNEMTRGDDKNASD